MVIDPDTGPADAEACTLGALAVAELGGCEASARPLPVTAAVPHEVMARATAAADAAMRRCAPQGRGDGAEWLVMMCSLVAGFVPSFHLRIGDASVSTDCVWVAVS